MDVKQIVAIMRLTQHVEEEPVSHITLLDYSVDDLSSDESESNVEQVSPHFGTNDYNDPVDNDKEAKDAKKDEPEPEENVNFLIDDVERQ